MGLISLPIMLRYGYDRRMATGIIANNVQVTFAVFAVGRNVGAKIAERHWVTVVTAW